MLKSFAPWIIAAALIVFLAFLLGSNNNKEKIEDLIKENSRLAGQKVILDSLVRTNDKKQEALNGKISELEAERNDLKEKVNTLEIERKANQLSVRELRNSDQIVQRLIKTYPQLNERTVFIFEHPIDKTGLIQVDYAGIPSAFLETFMIEHDQADKYKNEKEALEKAGMLGEEIIALKDKIFTLEKEKSTAYKSAYDDAYNAYMKINKDYIDELKKPRFELPQWGAIIGGVAAGYLIGRN